MVRVRSNQIASDISSPTAAILRMIGPKSNPVLLCLRVVAGHVKTRQAGCAQPITIPAETGLVRKGFRKLRHKLILPIGWRLILGTSSKIS